METPKRAKEEISPKSKDMTQAKLEIAKNVGQEKSKKGKAMKKAKDSESSEDESDSSDDSDDLDLSSDESESSEDSDDSESAPSDGGEGGSTEKKKTKKGQIYKDLLQPSNHGQIILGQCKTCKEGQKEELEPIVATEKMGLVAKFFQCANCLKGNQQLANVVKQFYGKEDDNQMTANYHYSETDDYKALSPKYVTIFSQCKYCRERQGRYCESGAEYCRKKGPKRDTQFLLLATCTSCAFANKMIQSKYWAAFSLYGNKDAKDKDKAEEELNKLKKELKKMKKKTKKDTKK